MNQSLVSIKIGNFWLDKSYIIDFNLSADETTLLPTCNIRLHDIGGAHFSSFKDICIGSYVEVNIFEDSVTPARIIKYPKFVIVAINSDITEMSSGEDTLELICSHPWALSKDYSSHAYAGMKNSNIIKNILSNSSNRPFKFLMKDAYWEDSDEDGNIPRYKCLESDMDFITTKLLPYTTIKSSPALFWIDELSIPHLQSFKNLFTADTNTVFIPGYNFDVINTDQYKNYTKIFGADSCTVSISDDNPEPFLNELKAKISYEEPKYTLTFSGTLPVKISIGNDTSTKNSKLNQGKLPLDLFTIINTKASDSKVYLNRNLDDEIALSINAQKILYNMFSINIDTYFCGDAVRTGENMSIYIPKLSTGKIHWLNGVWHIRSVKHYLTDEGMRSKLTLIRPSFTFNKDNTSIDNADSLYGVI